MQWVDGLCPNAIVASIMGFEDWAMRSCSSMATACGLLRNSGLQIAKKLRVPCLIVELDTLWDDTDGLVYLNNPPNSISPFAAD
ncbi:hypothetical protein Gorai_021658, partial [Gossypium raimondii]|nr:hypothetical protein [Gossypium raimondii]